MPQSIKQVIEGESGIYVTVGANDVLVGKLNGWNYTEHVEIYRITAWSSFAAATTARLEHVTATATSPGNLMRALEADYDPEGTDRFALLISEKDEIQAANVPGELLTLSSPWSLSVWDAWQGAGRSTATLEGRVYRYTKSGSDTPILEQWFFSPDYTGPTSGGTKVWLEKQASPTSITAFRDAVATSGAWQLRTYSYHWRTYSA